ncbi:DUF4129 domain-containing protein [Gracilibacillus sp. D59]|uniref:DUF4129 domain-containing protein n=1 Tax=Gracilibacillus sp. D59 TaxID=3457434 RepID=UPI003FCD9BDF
MSSFRKEREQLNDILNKEEYQVYYDDNRSFLERIWDKVSDWIGDILQKLFDSFEPASTAGNLIIVLIVLLVSAVFLFGIITLVMFTVRKRRLSKQQLFTIREELNWRYNDHLQASKEYESQANYQLATRHQFLALLLILDENRLLQAKQWKTNWDYYDELKQSNKPLAVDFYNLALFFEKVTYGEQTIAEDDYRKYKEQVNRWIDSTMQQLDTKEIGER